MAYSKYFLILTTLLFRPPSLVSLPPAPLPFLPRSLLVWCLISWVEISTKSCIILGSSSSSRLMQQQMVKFHNLRHFLIFERRGLRRSEDALQFLVAASPSPTPSSISSSSVSIPPIISASSSTSSSNWRGSFSNAAGTSNDTVWSPVSLFESKTS